jgi:hypothetical protein
MPKMLLLEPLRAPVKRRYVPLLEFCQVSIQLTT